MIHVFKYYTENSTSLANQWKFQKSIDMLISAVMIVKNIIFQGLHFVYDVYPCFSDKKNWNNRPPASH